LPINFNYKGNLRLQALQAFQAYTYYDYRAGDDILQIKKYKNINAAQAKKIIADRKFFVNAQFFSTAVHPLPDTNSYDKAIRPLYTEDTSLMRLNYRLLASSNLIYTPYAAKGIYYYYCLYTVFFCSKENALVEFKIFTPVESPAISFNDFCNKVSCVN
jgi:hypothetical protein